MLAKLAARSRRRAVLGSLSAAALVLTAAACGGSDNGKAAGGTIHLEFWGWAPGYDKSA